MGAEFTKGFGSFGSSFPPRHFLLLYDHLFIGVLRLRAPKQALWALAIMITINSLVHFFLNGTFILRFLSVLLMACISIKPISKFFLLSLYLT